MNLGNNFWKQKMVMQKEFGKIAHDFVNYEQSIKLVFNPKF